MFERIAPWLFKKKVIIILGARQVGKTTVSKFLLERVDEGMYVKCERISVKELLEGMNPEKFKVLLVMPKL